MVRLHTGSALKLCQRAGRQLPPTLQVPRQPLLASLLLARSKAKCILTKRICSSSKPWLTARPAAIGTALVASSDEACDRLSSTASRVWDDLGAAVPVLHSHPRLSIGACLAAASLGAYYYSRCVQQQHLMVISLLPTAFCD